MSLVPLMKLRLATPVMVVDVGRVRELSYVRDAGDHVEVGAVALRNSGTRVALVNMGGTPLRAVAVEEALNGGASIDEAAERAADGTEPPEDINATPEYCEHLVRVLVRRALEAASA